MENQTPDKTRGRESYSLDRIRKTLEVALTNLDTDFFIKSEQVAFPVHACLLKKLWPFFNTATCVNMAEQQTQSLYMSYSKYCVEQLIHFLYGKQVDIPGQP